MDIDILLRDDRHILPDPRILYKDEREVFMIARASTSTLAFKNRMESIMLRTLDIFSMIVIVRRRLQCTIGGKHPGIIRPAATVPDDGETRNDLPHLRLPVRVY